VQNRELMLDKEDFTFPRTAVNKPVYQK